MSATSNTAAKPDHVRFGSKADVTATDTNVRSVPIADISRLVRELVKIHPSEPIVELRFTEQFN